MKKVFLSFIALLLVIFLASFHAAKVSANEAELLNTPWHLSGSNGASEAYQTFDSNKLSGKDTLRITYNLHGLNTLGGDASAIIFDQNGWQYISLSNYGQNGLDGEQTVEIPLSDFMNFDPELENGSIHTRFWYHSNFSVDITSIVAFSTSSSPTPTPEPTPTPTPTQTSGQSGLTRSVWLNIPGTHIGDLLGSGIYPNSPSFTETINRFDTNIDEADNYGQKVHGYLKPPTGDNYEFWIAGDDFSELWLSTNDQQDNKVKIAEVPGWTHHQEWNKYSQQHSSQIWLDDDRFYYIEGLMKEGGGGDHLSVGWNINGNIEILEEAYLFTSPFEEEAAPELVNERVSLDLNNYCTSIGLEGVDLIGPHARDWVCTTNDGYQLRIDMTLACGWQYTDTHPFTSLDNANDPYSWGCNSLPQAPWPDGDETELSNNIVLTAKDTGLVSPPPCPSGLGPEGITAGDYPPQRLTQQQRQWLYEAFGNQGTASVGYGGERCATSNDDSNQNFFDMVCRRGHVGPGGILPGDYPPQNLTQDQRQFLFEEFGNQGTAPVGYGGQRCLGQDQNSVWDIHVASVCSSGATGPNDLKPQGYPPQDLIQEERQWLWDIFQEEGDTAPVGYGGQWCPWQTQNAPAPNRNNPPVIASTSCPSSPGNLSLGDIAVVGTSGLNAYSDPRLNSQIQTTFSYGELVTVISGPSCADGNLWWQVGAADSRGGFITEVSPAGNNNLVRHGEPLPGYEHHTFPEGISNPQTPEETYYTPANAGYCQYRPADQIDACYLHTNQIDPYLTDYSIDFFKPVHDIADIIVSASATYDCVQLAAPPAILFLAAYEPVPPALVGWAIHTLGYSVNAQTIPDCAEEMSEWYDIVVADLNSYYNDGDNMAISKQRAQVCNIDPADAISYMSAGMYPHDKQANLECLMGTTNLEGLTSIY